MRGWPTWRIRMRAFRWESPMPQTSLSPNRSCLPRGGVGPSSPKGVRLSARMRRSFYAGVRKRQRSSQLHSVTNGALLLFRTISDHRIRTLSDGADCGDGHAPIVLLWRGGRRGRVSGMGVSHWSASGHGAAGDGVGLVVVVVVLGCFALYWGRAVRPACPGGVTRPPSALPASGAGRRPAWGPARWTGPRRCRRPGPGRGPRRSSGLSRAG
jgi:hypothetical protein